jgi:methionyl-tRNA formyltransferase
VRCELAITQPDRPGGRGQKLQPTPVKTAARALGIATLEPERLREAIPVLRALAADLYAVASYGKIVPQAVLDLPRLGALNVHPSLLPLYRGATPLQAQLRDGVTHGGVTIILMDAGMDTGDIVAQHESAIGPRETYGELHDRFALLGARLLGDACARVASGTLAREPQAGRADACDVARTLTRPLSKDDLALAAPGDDLRAFAVVDKIRSLSPAPGARLDLPRFGRSKVLAGHAVFDGPPVEVALGTCVAIDGWLLLRALDGWVAIDELGVPGRRAMPIADFRSGNRLTEPDNLRPVLERWLGENETRLAQYARA